MCRRTQIHNSLGKKKLIKTKINLILLIEGWLAASSNNNNNKIIRVINKIVEGRTNVILIIININM